MTSTITIKTDTAPSTPASGYSRLYVKSDSRFYYKDDAGVEHALAAPSGCDFSGQLAASIASNALTIAVKTLAGADPSVSNPVLARFRNVTPGTGDVTETNITAALSLVVSSGSTLGAVNSVPFRAWVVLFNDAGTLRVGIINCTTTAAGAGAGRDVTSIFPLAGWGIASSTAEGGTGSADSAQVFYTDSAVTSKPYTVIGYVTYESGLATVGTYSSAPSRVQVFSPNTPLPGQVVQVQRNSTGALATGTTIIPNDDTIPQNTEGDQYMSQAITPTSAVNALHVRAQMLMAMVSSNPRTMALFQDSTANALAAAMQTETSDSNALKQHNVEAFVLAAGTASTTFKVRAGGAVSTTTTFNGVNGARVLGGAMNSYVEVRELMA